MARPALNRGVVVAEAARLADEIGLERLTLAALARSLKVAVPSLYKHIGGLDALMAELALLATRELTEGLQRAAVGLARGDALRALAAVYRGYVSEHPGRYMATVRAPVAGEERAAERHTAAEQAVAVVYAVLEGYGISGDARVDATRALRSALHGFALIEAAGGFGIPRDIDRSFDAMVDGFDRLLRSWGDVAGTSSP